MPVTFTCNCGEPLEVDDQYAGMNVECPECHALSLAPERSTLRVVKPIRQKRVRATDVAYDDEYDDDDRPRRRRRKPEPKKHSSMEGRVWSGSVMGGLLAMLIAVIWFVGGLFAGFLFYYPPILFIIGLVGMIRGLIADDED